MIKLFLALLLFATTANAEFKNTDAQYLPDTNYLGNPGGENGKTKWTASGGTFTSNTTAANVASGKASLAWDASGTQTFRSNAVTIPAGLYGNNCLGKIKYLGGDTNLTLQVLDGSNNVLGSQALSAQTTFKTETVSFVCPTSGSFKLGLSAGANAAIVYLDDMYLGANYMVGMASQATLYGGAVWPATASCTWTTTSSSFANFSADTDCTNPSGGNLKGNALAPSTKVPGIRFSSLSPGRYLVMVTGDFSRGSTTESVEWRISDGTTASNQLAQSLNTNIAINTGVVTGWLDYTTAQAETTIQIQARNSGGTASVSIANTAIPLDIQVYRFPSTQEQTLRTDQVGWRVSANISGANASLGTTSVSSYTGITNSGLTMVQNSGSISVQIPCSTTVASSGLTCSGGDESIGVVYNQPVAGPVMACASFAHVYNLAASASNAVEAIFQIVETPNAAQTISTEGGSRVASGADPDDTIAFIGRSPNRVCGVFNFTSAGQKTLRLFYEQSTSGTLSSSVVSGDASASSGQRDIHWEVYPLAQYVSQPVIVNSVSSNGAGPWRTEAARIDCDGASTIPSQTGTWISTIGNISSGRCTLTFPAGAFSATPFCVATPEAGSVDDRFLTMDHQSATSVIVGCYDVSGAGNCADYDANIHCMGAR